MYLLSQQVTSTDIQLSVGVGLIVAGVYIARKHKPFDSIWQCIHVFVVVLLTYLVVNSVADKFKKK